MTDQPVTQICHPCALALGGDTGGRLSTVNQTNPCDVCERVAELERDYAGIPTPTREGYW